ADASVGLSGPRRLTGTFVATLPDLRGLVTDPAVFGWPLSGSGQARGTLGGTLTAPDIRADVTLADVVFAGQRIDGASADVTVRGSRLQVEALVARVDAARLSGTLTADLERQTHRAALTVTDWPIQDVPASSTVDALPLAGRVSGTLETSGP